MNPRQTQLAMMAIELHGQEWSGEEFVSWLLGFSDPEATGRVLIEEARRAFVLAENHYQRVSQRVAVLEPVMISEVGFIQGATFAAAAMGREPFPASFAQSQRSLRDTVLALKEAAMLDGVPASVADAIATLDTLTK